MELILGEPIPITALHWASFAITMFLVIATNVWTMFSIGDIHRPNIHPAVMFCYKHSIENLFFGTGMIAVMFAGWYLTVAIAMIGFILSILRDNFIDAATITA
jgi:hypothetical protein